MTFKVNHKLDFIGSFQFLSSSLNSVVKKLGKDDFKYLNQEFDSKVLDLVKQNGCYSYEYMSDFRKFKEQLLSKKKFYSSLTGNKLLVKSMNMFLMKDYYGLWLKYDVLLFKDLKTIA